GVVPRIAPLGRLDLIPVEVDAHDVDAERLELVEPVVQRAGAVSEPGVVLDPVADVGRSPHARCDAAGGESKADEGDGETHRSPAYPGRREANRQDSVRLAGLFRARPGRAPDDVVRTLASSRRSRAASRFAAPDFRDVADGGEPDVDAEGDDARGE